MSKRIYNKKQINTQNKLRSQTINVQPKEEDDKFDFDENDNNTILKAFQHFDADHNGKINVEEIKHVLTFLGDIMTKEEVDKFFKSVDIDKNGCLDYREFINFWMNSE